MFRNLQQSLIFFMLSLNSLCPNNNFLYKSITQQHVYLNNNIIEEIISDEEQLIIDLTKTIDGFYKKIIEITALYLTGVIKSSDQFHKQILLETYKHILYSSTTLTQYTSKLLKNPKISLKLKIKRCIYISSFLIFVTFLTKEGSKSSNPDSNFSNYQHSIFPQFEPSPSEIQNLSSQNPRPKSKCF